MIPNEEIRVLIAEDDPEVRSFLETALRCQHYAVESVQDGVEAMNLIAETKGGFAVALLDLLMPRKDGFETLREIRRGFQNLPVIVVSGAGSPMNVVEAMKNGATNFLAKPVTHEDLHRAITSAINAELEPGRSDPRRSSGAREAPTIFGSDPRMAHIGKLVEQVGWSEVPVLIQGETGVGKEVLARQIHAHSPRAKKGFLKLNCAALPQELVESELFGYERGAFTGAFQRKPGMFENADGGTLLLDEIGDMPYSMQAKLLQVLQDQEFLRLGGREVVKTDVRVIAATHQDLEKAMIAGTFRMDLYYRLNVVSFHVPPLRERRGDLMELSERMLDKHLLPGSERPEITPALRDAMLAHSWPGNVRELENVIRKLAVLGEPDLLVRELRNRPGAARLVSPAAGGASEPEPDTSVLRLVNRSSQQAETEAILGALQSTRWNRKRAAALLQIDYKALLYKMKKLSIESRYSSDLNLAS
jgi:two-component system response regulator AtoC